MSVDKFGRYSEIRSTSRKTSCLPLTPDGDYDIGNKRLKHVRDPKYEKDAINMKHFKNETLSILKLEGDSFDAKDYKIKNLHDPEGLDHAVNVNYIARLMGEVLYDFNNKLVNNNSSIVLQQDKEWWVDKNVIQKYFINKGKTKIFRTSGINTDVETKTDQS